MARARETVENLHALLTATATHAPERVAIVEPGAGSDLVDITYGRLAAQIDAYTEVLDGLGLDVGDRVLIESNTSGAAVAMLLACARLGLPFVPVSPEVPDSRISSIIDAVTPALYVRPLGRRRIGTPPDTGTGTFAWEQFDLERRPAPRTRHRGEVLASDTAYIIFTSGTSGRPKGVVMSHRSVVTFLRAVLGDGLIGADERIASTSPLHFDFALFDIGIALGGGATLVPVPREQLASPRRLVAYLQGAGVTQVDGVPSIWRPVLRHHPDLLTGLTRLRTVLFAGEEFPLPELRRLQEVLRGVRVVNGYGATESMACSFTEVPNPLPADVTRLSIGAVHTGAEVTLVDERGAAVTEPGAVGEMYLRSPSLFSGYWNDPDGSDGVLVKDPLDPRHGQVLLRTGDLAFRDAHGGLFFCGRADSQVQIRGNRVELGEIEATLARFPGVQAAVAVAVTRQTGDHTLAAFVVMADAGETFDSTKALEFCARELPAYMVPREIHPVAEIPLTVNGKADRALLGARRRPTGTDRSSVPTRTEATT